MNKLYAAPLEGITGFVWRNAHRTVFGGVDKYYTPFISPNSNLCFQTKELRDISQGEKDLVPQLITKNGEHFIWAARELHAMGYDEVNFNLGCPSGTVVAKHKGSGLLRHPDVLDALLDEIFSALPDMKISIKTRIGMTDKYEWPAILAVYNRYPIYELTVHPRLQAQHYNGTADREVFLETLKASSLSLVYNGDVYAPNDDAFQYGCGVMVGRGLTQDSALFRRVRGGKAASRDELTQFHDMVLEGYSKYISGDVSLMHRMWEFWHFFVCAFYDTDDAIKRMRKAKNIVAYRSAADEILRNHELRNK